ncbi:MAG: hypothetical protein PWP24_1080, partial [Clostridiales bacterium]|nr:hypothetical protein [Clostridiales bacterium]
KSMQKKIRYQSKYKKNRGIWKMKASRRIKKIIIVMVSTLLLIVIVFGGLFTFYMIESVADLKKAESKTEVRPLTKQEQIFVGLWEAEDGSLLAIRPRGGFDARDFALDAICKKNTVNNIEVREPTWEKITRDIYTVLEERGDLLVISDTFDCPDVNDPDGLKYVQTEERLEYDTETDIITHFSIHQAYDGGGMEEFKTVFHRTDGKPTDKSVDWEWYYDIHPHRRP